MNRTVRVVLFAAMLVASLTFAAGGSRASTPATGSPVAGTTGSDPCFAVSGGAMASPTSHDHMSGMSDGTPMSGMSNGSPMAGMTDTDLMFIDMMIVHHQGAIRMAEVALQRAEHQELKDFANSIITTQTAEIEQMQAWRDAWYPDAPVTTADSMASSDMGGSMMDGMADPMMDGNAMLDVLCSATSDFDLVFIDLMTSHHNDAVIMANHAMGSSTHDEMGSFLQGIIDTQSAEIEQMATWRAEWYPDASPAANDGMGGMDGMETPTATG